MAHNFEAYFKSIVDELDHSGIDYTQNDENQYINFNVANMGFLPSPIIKRVNQLKLRIATPYLNYRLRDNFIDLIKQKISILCPDPTGKSLHVSYGTTLSFNLLCLLFKVRNLRQNFVTLEGEHDGLLAPFYGFTNLQVLKDIDALRQKLQTCKVDGICVSDICYKDGKRNNLRLIAELRKQYAPDAIIIADLAQSFSIVDLPFEYFDIGIASAHKWMAGAGGHGFIWISSALEQELLMLKGDLPRFNKFGFVGGNDFKSLLETYQAVMLRIKSNYGYKRGLSQLIDNFNVTSKLQIKTNTKCFHIIDLKGIDRAYEIYSNIINQNLDVKLINDSNPVLRITIPYYASDIDVSRGFDILVKSLSHIGR